MGDGSFETYKTVPPLEVEGGNWHVFKSRFRIFMESMALEHIEHHKLDGIVYFADEDNIYFLELFENLREIRYLSLNAVHVPA